jgi:hypothetical protein
VEAAAAAEADAAADAVATVEAATAAEVWVLPPALRAYADAAAAALQNRHPLPRCKTVVHLSIKDDPLVTRGQTHVPLSDSSSM